MSSTTSEPQIQELTLRARCFYLSRKKSTPIDFDAYKTHVASRAPSSTPPIPQNFVPENEESTSGHPAVVSTEGKAPYPPTFAEIVDMITTGKPIPGIIDIPPTTLPDQATKSVASKRRKPWETDVDEETIQGGMGTFGDQRDTFIKQDFPTDV